MTIETYPDPDLVGDPRYADYRIAKAHAEEALAAAREMERQLRAMLVAFERMEEGWDSLSENALQSGLQMLWSLEKIDLALYLSQFVGEDE